MTSRTASLCRLGVESLEDRTVPYALSGFKWANVNVSASFVPDGTIVAGGYPSALFARYDATYPTATWQREFARALQTWASVSPLNFRFVADGGQSEGTTGQAQADSRFGDIRYGAKPLGSAMGYAYYPSSSTLGGDANINSDYVFNIGSVYDLYSLVLHETGHALGLAHSSVYGAVMRSSAGKVFTGLTPDDVAGIRAIYGARQPDAYDARSANDTLATATPVAVANGAVTLTADLTTVADVDAYQLTIPSGSDGTATVGVDARGLSLLAPKVSVYDAAGRLVTTATAGTAYGTAASVTLTGLQAGQTYTVVADGATGDVFGMGAYRLAVQFGGFTPALSSSTTASTTSSTTTTTTAGGGALMPADDCDECEAHAGGEHDQAWYFGPLAGDGPRLGAVRTWDEATSPRRGPDDHQDEFVIPVDTDHPRTAGTAVPTYGDTHTNPERGPGTDWAVWVGPRIDPLPRPRPA